MQEYASRLETRLFKGKLVIDASRRRLAKLAKSPSLRDTMVHIASNHRQKRKQGEDGWSTEVLAKVRTPIIMGCPCVWPHRTWVPCAYMVLTTMTDVG